MATRPQPYRLKWPLSPHQVEGADDMFEILFKATRALEDRMDTLSVGVSSTPAANTVTGMTGAMAISEDEGAETSWPSGTYLQDPVTPVHGGTGINQYVLGDTLYASGANILSTLSGNITSTLKFLSQTGTGTVSAAPSWQTPPTGGSLVFFFKNIREPIC